MSGSSHALVLSSTSQAGDEPKPPGERAAALLKPYLDASTYTAVAVVHGLGARAPKAFDLAKQRLTKGRGVVWVTDVDLLDELTGPDAAVLRKAFSPTEGALMTFYNVKSRKVVVSLKWMQVTLPRIDSAYLEAGLG